MIFPNREPVASVRAIAAISGLACVSLVVAAGRFAGSQPAALNTPPHLVRAFYLLRHTPVGLSTYLAALGLTAFLCFVVSLRSVLVQVEGQGSILPNLAFAGGVGVVALGLVGDLFLATLAFRATSMETQTAWILFTLWNMSLSFVWFPASILVGAVCLAIVRTGVLPRWLGLLGFPLALACLVVPTAGHHTTGPLVYGGGYLLPLGASFLLWVLAISVNLVRPNPTQTDPAAASTYRVPMRRSEDTEPEVSDDGRWSEALP